LLQNPVNGLAVRLVPYWPQRRWVPSASFLFLIFLPSSDLHWFYLVVLMSLLPADGRCWCCSVWLVW
jgi:hypothetical protein